MKIRSYELDDSNQVSKLFVQFVEYHEKLGEHFNKVKNHEEMFILYIESNMNNPNFYCAIAEINKKVVGYCISKVEEKPPVYPEPKFGYIDNICVGKKIQNKGIGEKLLEDAQLWFKSKGIKRVECFVATRNANAKAFWEREGFSPFIEQLFKIIKKFNKMLYPIIRWLLKTPLKSR